MLKNNTLLITGGTGSFGNAVLNRFLDTDQFMEQDLIILMPYIILFTKV